MNFEIVFVAKYFHVLVVRIENIYWKNLEKHDTYVVGEGLLIEKNVY